MKILKKKILFVEEGDSCHKFVSFICHVSFVSTSLFTLSALVEDWSGVILFVLEFLIFSLIGSAVVLFFIIKLIIYTCKYIKERKNEV
jgi:hypothetical protein